MAPTLTFFSSPEPPVGGLRVDVDLAAGRVTLTGELDRITCGQLVAACRLLTAAGPPVCVLDLSAVIFCDAPGLRALTTARDLAQDAGAGLVLAGARPFLRRLLARCGLGDVLTPIARTAPTPADARMTRPAEVAPPAGPRRSRRIEVSTGRKAAP